MKKLILWMASLGALCAQDIVGTWQGVVAPNGVERRLVIKITRDGGNLIAGLYRIDAGPNRIASSAVALQGSAVKITFPAARMTYEGRAGADGNSIAGALTQGTDSLTLNLTRATPATEWTIPEPPPPPAAMAKSARAVFEAATIKPAPPDAKAKSFTVGSGQVQLKNRSLAELIGLAYNLHSAQVIGAAGWIGTERYDITGTPEAAGQPNLDQLRQMLRNLLAERFSLKFHMEERELSVYAITIAQPGQHKLAPTSRGGTLPSGDFGRAGVFVARNSTIADLAAAFQARVLDRPVVDRTGIAGRFDFALEWRPDDSQFDGRAATMPKPPNADSLPDLFTAFPDQLGLRIQAVKSPTNVFVIDSAQKPSEN